MKKAVMVKEELLRACEAKVSQRIQSIQEVLQSIEESRNNETKSSAGDKYETGRAMMQMEEDKNRGQLLQALQVQQELAQIDPHRLSEQVGVGSLVETTQGKYFLSIGIGKVSLGDEIYFCLSSQSPIGRVMMGKAVGDIVEFNGKTIKITGVR
jgi:hypothetical protein